MQCPIDQSELRLAERPGVEIDYCPHCRGAGQREGREEVTVPLWVGLGNQSSLSERVFLRAVSDRVTGDREVPSCQGPTAP